MESFDILQILTQLVLIAPGFLLAITVHEYTHGYVALRLGDPTAKLAGRLTFNPISHLDPIGTLALVLTRMIGWAKPVPVDPRFLRSPRRDMLWISLGGPAANLVAAVCLALLVHFVVFLFEGRPVTQFSVFFVEPLFRILRYGVRINIVLAVFNLIPVPPLDGASIVAGLLPRELAYRFEMLQPYGFIILLLLIFSGAVSYIVVPPIVFIERLLLTGLS
ncbi:MAG: site-2 protease family protein [Deltaproteobacteria bacterium]|nr:site-2 protease family protein [Deltaproteobacteria bacterium]